MPIAKSIVDEVLVRCGRRCCLCRRFDPLHLQVHHIVVRSKGGGDEPDNLITLCLTCHCDVHAETRFTQRFTNEELKGHRNKVYQLVESGGFPSSPAGLGTDLNRWVTDANRRKSDQMTERAVEVLVRTALSDDGHIRIVDSGDREVQIGSSTVCSEASAGHRTFAEWARAIEDCLRNSGLARRARGTDSACFEITQSGYVLADELVAGGAAQRLGMSESES